VLLIWNDPSSSGVLDGFMLDSRKRKDNYVLAGADAMMLAVGDT
jgi:hypothetical protein